MVNPFNEILDKLNEILQKVGTVNHPAIEIIERLITTKELCEFLGVTEPTVIRYRQKGKIPFYRIGSAIRYNKNKVIEALEIDSNKGKNSFNKDFSYQIYKKGGIENLDDWYIANQLEKAGLDRTLSLKNNELIELKRNQLKFKREIKKIKK